MLWLKSFTVGLVAASMLAVPASCAEFLKDYRGPLRKSYVAEDSVDTRILRQRLVKLNVSELSVQVKASLDNEPDKVVFRLFDDRVFAMKTTDLAFHPDGSQTFLGEVDEGRILVSGRMNTYETTIKLHEVGSDVDIEVVTVEPGLLRIAEIKMRGGEKRI